MRDKGPTLIEIVVGALCTIALAWFICESAVRFAQFFQALCR